jgi:hypothetical protein
LHDRDKSLRRESTGLGWQIFIITVDQHGFERSPGPRSSAADHCAATECRKLVARHVVVVLSIASKTVFQLSNTGWNGCRGLHSSPSASHLHVLFLDPVEAHQKNKVPTTKPKRQGADRRAAAEEFIVTAGGVAVIVMTG